jgi:hypothetical protein
MTLIRASLAVVLLLIAAFCALGFMATFESPGWLVLRIGYAGFGIACLAGAIWILFTSRRGR